MVKVILQSTFQLKINVKSVRAEWSNIFAAHTIFDFVYQCIDFCFYDYCNLFVSNLGITFNETRIQDAFLFNKRPSFSCCCYFCCQKYTSQFVIVQCVSNQQTLFQKSRCRSKQARQQWQKKTSWDDMEETFRGARTLKKKNSSGFHHLERL